jgi:NitT/TauT family transport system substrate-binding protein
MRAPLRAATLVAVFSMLAVLLTACGGSDTATNTPKTAASSSPGSATPSTGGSPAAGLTNVTIGYVPVLVFGPVLLAQDKGYFAQYGLNVNLQPLPGGADMVVLTANGNFDIGIGGTGPAYFNAAARGVNLKIISPLHFERAPQATPLMVSKKRFDSGELTKVSDLKGKKVSVNARGATEYWLDTALRTEGLTIADVDLQTLGFPDVPAALDSGALDGAMLGEPLATQAEQQGLAVRLNVNFPANFQPTFAWVNPDFAQQHHDLVVGFEEGMMRGCRDLLAADWDNETNLAILQKYTKVPADLIRAASRTYCEPNGDVHQQDLATLQTFFKDRGLLEYDTPLDVATLVDTSYVTEALQKIGNYAP